MSEMLACNTKSRVKRQRCDEASQTSITFTAKIVVDVIDIDDSKNSETSSALDALHNPVGMVDGPPGPVLPVSIDLYTGHRAELENTP